MRTEGEIADSSDIAIQENNDNNSEKAPKPVQKERVKVPKLSSKKSKAVTKESKSSDRETQKVKEIRNAESDGLRPGSYEDLNQPKQNGGQVNGGAFDTTSMNSIQSTIAESMKSGFSELAKLLTQSSSSIHCHKRGKSPAKDPSTHKRARPSTGEQDFSESEGENSEPEPDIQKDVEDLLKNGSSEDESEDLFGNIEEEYDIDEKCGPPVSEKLAGIVNKMARAKLTDELVKEKLNKFKRPKNCDKLVSVKVNPEIWCKITSKAKSRDRKIQKIQGVLMKATAGLAYLTDKLSKSDKESALTVINSMALIMHANCELHHRRRDLIKPDLNWSYQQICSEQLQVTNWLFGDELTQKIRDINTTNKVGSRLLDTPRNYRASRYDNDRRSYASKNGSYSRKWQGQRQGQQYYNKKKEEGRGEK